MTNPSTPESQPNTEPNESFGELFSEYERTRARDAKERGKQLEGTVISVTADSVLVDIGGKTEGIFPLSSLRGGSEKPQPGDRLAVTIIGRDPEGYYQLSPGKVVRTTDWPSLEAAFAEKTPIVGVVTSVIKGGATVDVGVRAFLPASRSGVRDAAEMEKLVGQQVRCRIIQLDVESEDVVVDRRSVLEEEERAAKDRRYEEIQEGQVLSGEVRSLMDYGAFVDLGGVDALLHVSDLAWHRVTKPGDVLTTGQTLQVKVLKVDRAKGRIAVGLKQLQADPWEAVAEKYQQGQRVRGTVTRIADFGAFVELEPAIEGLIHISEMSWGKKVRNPGDVVKRGETVEAVILKVQPAERRIALGLKQALGDPWADAPQKFPVGAVIEGPVTSLAKFGAFVQLAEGIEGMVHISEISAEKRLNHPQEVLRMGEVVRAQVLEVDPAKRLVRLSMKQLVPSSLDEYMAEHNQGDVVSGRCVEFSGGSARVELGEGVQGIWQLNSLNRSQEDEGAAAKSDVSSLGSLLQARWKGGPADAEAPDTGGVRAGEIRSFRITKLDRDAKKIELELA